MLSGCVSESTYVANERQVTQRNVDNTEAAKTRISLGLNYLRRGDSTQALYNLERAKTMAPNLPEVYNALAFYYQTVGEHLQAENAYKQAIAKDSNNADAYNNYGAFLCQIERYADAERLLLSAISKPGYIRVAESYENLALCQLEQNGFEQARTYIGSSITHNGTRITALINSASLNYAMGNLADAKADLQRIQRLGRVSARSTLLNYLVSEKQGDVSTMRHAEQLLLTLYIDTEETRLLLQQRIMESEFEQLRERYKQHLLASLQPSGSTTVQSDAAMPQPVANPQLRIRRKTPEHVSPEVTRSTLAAHSAAVTTEAAAPQPVLPVPQSTVSQLTGVPSTEPQSTVPQSTMPSDTSGVNAVLPAPTDSTASVATSLQPTPALPTEQTTLIDAPASTTLPSQTTAQPQTIAQSQTIAQPVTSEVQASEPEKQKPVPVRLAAAQPVDEYYHLVAEGDTMFAISYRYNIRLERFLAWNQLTEQSRLKIGQKLYIVDPASINHE
ncbi:hypothetical protein GCM10008111_05530 [Alishewanella tabrizica]|uniref:LysM domain-containing protein n=2 Tax=Alishewanella tabrizica TaxID=671278 RepID=A0ABQ2WHW4_9ALTE|nr:hypothetical protein GCM10008111_05530 [Alishewanella tabrizica]